MFDALSVRPDALGVSILTLPILTLPPASVISSLLPGLAVPIPTFPLASTTTRCAPLVLRPSTPGETRYTPVPVESLKAKDGAAAVPEGARLLSVKIGPVIAELLIHSLRSFIRGLPSVVPGYTFFLFLASGSGPDL
jgi:hypothetical protein